MKMENKINLKSSQWVDIILNLEEQNKEQILELNYKEPEGSSQANESNNDS